MVFSLHSAQGDGTQTSRRGLLSSHEALHGFPALGASGIPVPRRPLPHGCSQSPHRRGDLPTAPSSDPRAPTQSGAPLGSLTTAVPCPSLLFFRQSRHSDSKTSTFSNSPSPRVWWPQPLNMVTEAPLKPWAPTLPAPPPPPRLFLKRDKEGQFREKAAVIWATDLASVPRGCVPRD